MSYDELELDKLGDEKSALFFLISDTDTTYNFLVALAFSQMFNLLCERADNTYGGRLPYHVRVLWDEAANTGQVPGLEKIVAVIRSREISLTLFYQAMSQCKALYKDHSETIMGNMPRKRTGYDAACYYDGKLLGRCTKADSDAYTLLMNACGGEAARVLREYAYFSPELKAILEKAALMQADRSRTGGMFHAPKSSPWGEVQSCEVLCPGVFLVSTASHGGTMVANEVAAVLSPAAKKMRLQGQGLYLL